MTGVAISKFLCGRDEIARNKPFGSSGYFKQHSGNTGKPRRASFVIIVRHFMRIFVPLNDRIMRIQLQNKLTTINLIQFYASTVDKPVEQFERFQSRIKHTLIALKYMKIILSWETLTPSWRCKYTGYLATTLTWRTKRKRPQADTRRGIRFNKYVA